MSKRELTQKGKDLIYDYKNVFGSEAGKRVLKDLEKFCFYKQPTFNGTSDTNIMIMREGQRSIYLYIQARLEKEIDKNE